MGLNASKPTPEQEKQLKSDLKSNCALAANVISQANVLILVSGAGFSADSGLAVYADVAKVKAYRERCLDYSDICEPHWIRTDCELFYGFWGQCFNDYRKTRPHEGYDIIARWRDDVRHGNSALASEFEWLQQMQVTTASPSQGFDTEEEDDIEETAEPYPVDGCAGTFFTFTSNVDAHSFDVFNANEIRECHGNVELWQCTQSGCGWGGGNGIWRAPVSHRFVVDMETMLAPEKKDDPQSLPGPTTVQRERSDQGSQMTGSTAHVGCTLGDHRVHLLKHMQDSDSDGWACKEGGNHPKCKTCGQLARPAIMMFGDMGWKDNEQQEKRWDRWNSALYHLCEIRGRVNSPLNVCILEVGCGDNVSTCRRQSEMMVDNIKERGGNVKLVRINPDYPLADDETITENVISIMSRGLDALKQIDLAYRSSLGVQS